MSSYIFVGTIYLHIFIGTFSNVLFAAFKSKERTNPSDPLEIKRVGMNRSNVRQFTGRCALHGN